MSSRDNNGSSRRRSGLLTHWVPLAITVAVATAGVAAWAWSQRQTDDDEDEHDGLDYGGVDNNQGRGGRPPSGPDPSYGGGGASSRDMKTGVVDESADPPTWSSRIGGALRRTPSPQQMFGSASKTVVAGVAAAGAAVGTALSAIREEDKTAYADHETWSEEADAKQERAATAGAAGKEGGKKRRTVAVVVSADSHVEDLGDDDFEHATILSHLPKHIDFSRTKLYILIYAPGLKDGGNLDTTGNNQAPSLSSSFSNIGHEQAQPTEGSKSPALNPTSGNPAFNSVYSQALSLVEKETMVLPFTTRNGHVHILRHLQPEIIYLQESLSGENGSVVTQVQTWLRYDLVLVVGAESGHGGLADSESEAETKEKEERWWQREDRVGRGRGVVVVDSMRVSDDWAKRVQGYE